MSAQVNLDNIVFLKQQIGRLEAAIQKQVKLSGAFNCLLIMLETDDIHRFANVGNFALYCRCVSTQRLPGLVLT